MTEDNMVAVDFHVKRYSDFDLLRIARAVGQGVGADGKLTHPAD
ncbi:hypothetical protein AAIH60_24510 [Pseudomonas aeruginosa]